MKIVPSEVKRQSNQELRNRWREAWRESATFSKPSPFALAFLEAVRAIAAVGSKKKIAPLDDVTLKSRI